MTTREQHSEKPGPLDKLLSVFTSVEPGEAGTALLLMLELFLVLTAYYILKTVREPLILMGGGAEVKSYAAAGQAILLLAVVPLYSMLVNKVERVRLINGVTLFFISNLVLFYLLARIGVPYLGVAFYLWVGIFSLMIIAQVWSFANDLYTENQGKRLFPLVAFGRSLGAIAGSLVAGQLFELGLGSFEMMLAAAALLVVCMLITLAIRNREQQPLARQDTPQPDVKSTATPDDQASGFALVLRDRYLLLIAVLLMLLNIVNTNGEYILASAIENIAANADPAAREQIFGSFYAGFFTWVNSIGAFLQLFAVSRILRLAGVRTALFVLPVIALGSYAVIASGAALAVIRGAKILENATDYSLNNTVRQALFLPTSRAAKYKAKQAIDTFFVRAGDVLSAGMVYVGVNLLGFGTRQFAMLNLVFIVIWLIVAAAIGARYRQMTKASA